MAATRWNDVPASRAAPHSWGGARFGSRLVDSRSLRVDAAPAAAFAAIRSIGGRNGWYHAGWLWRVRGWLDLLAGGPGMRRGRRDPEQLLPGDALDWWRVETIEPDRLLRLAAEMRLPGRAWLQYEVEPCAEGGAVIRQTALFDPLGLLGLAYWYALWPVHQYVFSGLLSQIARRAKAAGTRR
jgi:hypothetical protein